MAAVDVRVRHDDDLVVAQLGRISNSSRPMPVAERRDQGADLGRAQSSCRSAPRSTFKILPLQRQGWPESAGRDACLAEPPAESPSTMKSSRSGLGVARSWQSASLPGREATSSAPLLAGSVRAPCAPPRAPPRLRTTFCDDASWPLPDAPRNTGCSLSLTIDPRPPGGLRRTPACPWSGWRISGPAPSPRGRR